MEKKTFYVVTLVYVSFKGSSVDTFVLGHSSELSFAKSILFNKRFQLIKKGYVPDNFKSSPWQWTYNHKHGIIKAEIVLVRE